MNIGEIARRSGVSRSTVSYALSGKRPVSEETRRRIQAVIDELGYRPNATAKALKEGRTRTIALVIPPASRRLTDVQLGFVASVVDAAGRADLDVLLSPSGGEHDRSFERVIGGRRVDGVILMEIRLEDDRVTRLRQTGLPFVTIGRTHQPEDMTWVDIDSDTLISNASTTWPIWATAASPWSTVPPNWWPPGTAPAIEPRPASRARSPNAAWKACGHAAATTPNPECPASSDSSTSNLR